MDRREFVKSAAAKMNRAAGSRDSITLRGKINPRGAMDIHADVVAIDQPALTRVHPDADANGGPVQPVGGREIARGGNGGCRRRGDLASLR